MRSEPRGSWESSVGWLRHDDGVAGLQDDVLLEPFPSADVVVIKFENLLLAPVSTHDGDVLAVGELGEATGKGNHLQHRPLARQGMRTGRRDVAGDVDL